MADLPELWTDNTPERRYLFDRAPTFGLAREAERMAHGIPPVTRTTPRKPQRDRGPFLNYLSMPWSHGDRTLTDAWHRMQCRRGRHDISGGHTMQLGSTTVFIERRCRWCGEEARV